MARAKKKQIQKIGQNKEAPGRTEKQDRSGAYRLRWYRLKAADHGVLRVLAESASQAESVGRTVLGVTDPYQGGMEVIEEPALLFARKKKSCLN